MARVTKDIPLSDKLKETVAVTPAIRECVEALAAHDGISKAEAIRRMICAGIVARSSDIAPTWATVKVAEKDFIESASYLWTR